ncbi:MAG: hypothetical protein PUD74_04290 [Bacteroidales bacterium]|nr:hypothetical protein [Bacteroidales bacterium]MDD6828992.1 hypothetical protein [Bacteroidales bacterium]
MNFTKPNRAAIRYTNSQWLRKDATETSVGKVAVPKTGKKNALSREDGSDIPLGGVAVPKTVQKAPSPRGDVSEVPVEGVPVPRTDRDRREKPI